MRNDTRSRFLSLAIAPAFVSVAMVPMMVSYHAPDCMYGAIGFLGGLSIVALFWMVKQKKRCNTAI